LAVKPVEPSVPRQITHDFIGAPGGIRTPNPQIRSLMLYPVALRARVKFSFGSKQVERAHHSTEAIVAEMVRPCASFLRRKIAERRSLDLTTPLFCARTLLPLRALAQPDHFRLQLRVGQRGIEKPACTAAFYSTKQR
jgi:hypothetical protein